MVSMKSLIIVPGMPAPTEALGAVLVRDLSVDGEHWAKGRRLSVYDVERIVRPGVEVDLGPRGAGLAESRPGRTHAARSLAPASLDARSFTILVLEPGDVHEDEAALRLATAVAGSSIELRGPAESRIDLAARADGVLRVRAERVERIDRIDPLQLFTLYDGQSVSVGQVVASVKIGPHAVPQDLLERGLRIARSGPPLVWVAPFIPRRVAAVVRETVRVVARDRFERGVGARVQSLGSTLTGIAYATTADEVVDHLRRLTHGSERVDVVLTAGAASTDPTDPFFVAIGRLGGHVVRHGVPAHPGSMVWLARIHGTDLLGLPTCGAYSKATAADLLLPRLLTGERASSRMAASLGHGGVLTRAMRFRFPAYARALEAPVGGSWVGPAEAIE
jgi:hypothetical protein